MLIEMHNLTKTYGEGDQLVHATQGVNLKIVEGDFIAVVGPSGSGKSTLLAAIIRHIVEQEGSHRKVLTYESPIEFVFDSIVKPSSIVSQSEIPRHLPSFAAGVRNK